MHADRETRPTASRFVPAVPSSSRPPVIVLMPFADEEEERLWIEIEESRSRAG